MLVAGAAPASSSRALTRSEPSPAASSSIRTLVAGRPVVDRQPVGAELAAGAVVGDRPHLADGAIGAEVELGREGRRGVLAGRLAIELEGDPGDRRVADQHPDPGLAGHRLVDRRQQAQRRRRGGRRLARSQVPRGKGDRRLAVSHILEAGVQVRIHGPPASGEGGGDDDAVDLFRRLEQDPQPGRLSRGRRRQPFGESQGRRARSRTMPAGSPGRAARPAGHRRAAADRATPAPGRRATPDRHPGRPTPTATASRRRSSRRRAARAPARRGRGRQPGRRPDRPPSRSRRRRGEAAAWRGGLDCQRGRQGAASTPVYGLQATCRAAGGKPGSRRLSPPWTLFESHPGRGESC